MFHISARTAADWAEYISAHNDMFVRELRKDQSIEVSVFASRLTFNFLRALRELGADESERSHLVEHAAHGISHAVVQSLLWTEPPPLSPSQSKVN